MPLTSRDISVSIYSDGQELTPYGIEADEETRTVVAYIASTAGKTFEIRVDSLEVVRMPTIVKFFVDGSDARTRAVLPGKPYQDRIYQARISDALVVPMSFSEYDLVDPDETAAARDTRDLGTIQVLLYETSVRPIPQKRDNYAHGEEAEYRDIKDFSHVAETSKKAGGHRVVFDREKAVREKLPAVSRLYPVDTSKRTPFCSFRFFYQPKDLLMAKGIIPRPTLTQVSAECPDPRAFSISASPEPPRAAPSSSTVPRKRIKSDEDAQPGNKLHKSERKRRILDLEAELNALRAADQEVAGVKREGPPSPICVGDADGEVIDLTGDD